jgi:UDP-hydrolysing UDP-N-acetyl-D-glucosamine 2-epimerase
MKRRKICIVTGTRADYGLLYWLIHELHQAPGVDLQLIATGMHLSPEFGETWRVIQSDGFALAAKVDMLLSGDSPVAITKSMGLATIGFAEQFDRLAPDIVVVLGDRFEILAAAQAAMVARIPIAHIQGGEATEGLIDEAIRHSLTKMAQLHFTAADAYSRRVIQLGEVPERVFNTGALGLDNIRRLTLLERDELARQLDIELRTPLISVTYHPVTLSHQDPAEPMAELLAALDAFPQASVVLSKGNADTNGRVINGMIDAFVARRPDRTMAATSLGQLRYLSLLQHADVVLGNSSSGILEAPASGTPTVNVGDRQRGRLRSPSVIDCAERTADIVAALHQALSPDMQEVAARRQSPFGTGGAAERMCDILLSTPLEGLLMKRFYDLGERP